MSSVAETLHRHSALRGLLSDPMGLLGTVLVGAFLLSAERCAFRSTEVLLNHLLALRKKSRRQLWR